MSIPLIIAAAIAAGAVLAAAVSAVVCRYKLTIRLYPVFVEGVARPFTAACVSDLHCRQFGKDNARLLEQIRILRPDVIFTLGDVVSRDASGEDAARMGRLFASLQSIAPVFAALGNHEADYMKRTGTDLRPILRGAGAVLLDEECITTEIAGNRICLGGTLHVPMTSGRRREKAICSQGPRLLEQMRSAGLPSVVLSHRPDPVIFDRAYAESSVDLFLSGHTHGGLIRLPFIGGLFAPKQGLFPRYDRGYFRVGKTQLVISGGLAGYGAVPRVFNLPEICVLQIVPAE